MLKELTKMITIALLLFALFIGSVMLSNYVHYGTFIFK